MKTTLWFACMILVPAAAFGQAAAPAPKEEPKKEDADNPLCLLKTSMGDVVLELFPKEAPATVKNFIELAEGRKEFTDPKTGKKVKRPFFDGLAFHRVMKGFMIQGGCPVGDGTGSPGYSFEDEISATALGLDKIKAMTGKDPHPFLLIQPGDQADFNQKILFPLLQKMGIQGQEELQKRAAEVQAKVNELTLKDAYENMGYKYTPDLKSRHLVKGVLAMANSGPNTNGSQFFINLADTPWLDGKHTAFGKVFKSFDVVEKIGAVAVNPQSAKPLEDVKILSIRLVLEEKKK